ncbi:MAG: DUF3035 domain-containing protein [Sphingomonadales bacterium]|nr:DUF3035 domain-containing protein [Sphingomonadales bacterium]
MKRWIYVSAIIAGSLALQGCGAGKIFGGAATPNEFHVVSKPPLSMPPDYTLRPPRPGLSAAQNLPASTKALSILFGDEAAKVRPASDGEQALLDVLDARGRTSNIRSMVGNKDVTVVEKGALLDDILQSSERDGQYDKSSIQRVKSKDNG